MESKPRHADLSKKSLPVLLRLRAKLQARAGRKQVDLFLSQAEMTSNPRLMERLRSVEEEIKRRKPELQREAAGKLLADYKAHILRQMPQSSHSEQEEKPKGEVTRPAKLAGGNTREAILRPLLKNKGFSVHDWAKKAGVDFHTANDYLNGKTSPYQSTRKKLADALGVKVESLPA